MSMEFPSHPVPATETAYTPEVQQPPALKNSTAEVTLDRLIEVASPIVQRYLEAQERMQERNLEFEGKLLEHDSRRQRHVVWAVSAIIGVVLIFAAYLISQGRDEVALDVIKLVAALGSVGFGGYGIAMARRRHDEDDGQ